MKAILLSLLIFTAVAPEAAAQRHEITGTVTDAATRQAIIGANVLVEGTELGAATDVDGRFTVSRVPVGTHTLRVSYIGYETAYRTDVVVLSARPTQVVVNLREAAVEGEGVTVTASHFARPREVVNSLYGMSYEEIRRAAGGLGDVSRLVQNMPGVRMADDQRNDLVVRGGSPSENLTLVDNVEVPNLNHYAAQGTTGGPVSMLNTEFISEATFLAGGFPAQYGGRLSSVLDISLREGNRRSFAADIELGYAGAGLILEGPLSERGSWMASARRSFLDLVFGDFGLTAVPRYSNFQAKAVHRPNPNHKLWLVSIGGVDDIHFTVDPDDPDYPFLVDLTSGGWRAITGLNWQMLFGSGGYGVLGVSDAVGSFEVTARDVNLGDALVFRNASVEGETTLKYDLAYRIASLGHLSAGVSGKLFRNYLRIEQPLGFYSPFRADPGRVYPLDVDDVNTSFQGSAYAQLTRSVWNRLDLTAGFRYDYFGLIDASTLAPRLGASYALSPDFSFSLSYGTFHQSPAPAFVHAYKMNRDLKPMRSDHYTAGLAFFPRPDVKMSAEAYYKRYSNYPVSVDFPQVSLANLGDNYGVQEMLFPMVSDGTGQSRGIEVYLQKKLTSRLYGQVSYSYSRTAHTALDGISRPGAFDIPHVVSVIGGFKPSPGLEFSARFTQTSGRPYTPFLLEPSREQNRGIYDLDRVNARRSPHYQRLDLRFDRRHNFGTWSLTTFMEVQNVLDRTNTQQYVWNTRTKEPFAWNQLARFPVGGVNVKF